MKTTIESNGKEHSRHLISLADGDDGAIFDKASKFKTYWRGNAKISHGFVPIGINSTYEAMV